MKKIKIYMQYPWKITDSSYYKYLLENPPENVEFLNIRGKKGVIESKKKFHMGNKLKQSIKKIIKNIYPSMPNVHLTRTKEKYDLIHCAHCMSLNKRPWVMDAEYVGQLWAAPIKYGVYASKKKIRKYLSSKYCKKILAWTEWAKKETLEQFPELAKKIEIIYPAIPSQKFKKKESKNIVLLFSSRRFYFKGGLHAIEIMDRLTKKHKNVMGIIISATPKEILEKYGKNKKIKFLGLIPQERLFKEILPATDIFVYPSYTDTFGFGLMEALAFGIPVITVNRFCQGEIIKNNKTGFVIGCPKNINLESLEGQENLLKKLEQKTEHLIKNKKLRLRMGRNGLSEVKNGRFSIKKRNQKLIRIYKGALKKP